MERDIKIHTFCKVYPIDLLQGEGPAIQKLFRPVSEEGVILTLKDLLYHVIPELHDLGKSFLCVLIYRHSVLSFYQC